MSGTAEKTAQTLKLPVYDTGGKEAGTRDLEATVFGIEPSIPTMHQAHERQLANARRGTHETKRRGEVRGGGRKPWRQKGTGRARHGSIRSPIWRGGGVVFGPHSRSYEQKMPKKMRRLAIRSALSAKAQEDEIVLIQGLAEIEPYTRELKELLEELPNGERRTLIVIGPDGDWKPVYRAANNLPNVKVLRSGYINIHDVLTHERLLMTTEALEHVEELWAVR